MIPLADTLWIMDQANLWVSTFSGVVRAEQFPELQRMPEWLARGYAGEMKYLADPRRSHPQTVMPGIRSAIVGLLNYNTARPLSTDPVPHGENGEPRGGFPVMPGRRLSRSIAGEAGRAQGIPARTLYRSIRGARIRGHGTGQERVLAKYRRFGMARKNTLLLNQMLGLLLFSGVILTTLDLEPTLGANELPPDLCGTCRRCLDACPTQAFVEPYVMDARKCISYLTIELHGPIPEEFREPMEVMSSAATSVRTFARGIGAHRFPRYRSSRLGFFLRQRKTSPRRALPPQAESFYLPRLEWLLRLSEADFRELFRGSPVKPRQMARF